MSALNELLKHYKILLYWSEEDTAYLAEMPELPGCMADGATPEVALANLYEVAALWVETALELGRPVPVPAHSAHLLAAIAQARHKQGTRRAQESVEKASSKSLKSNPRKRKLSPAQAS